ncbi:L10-interacting MYB domain-containing protein-like [Neltuma alba]|uniref:L10-interacting MYB domain-containing protein-like n=1 Tax=Neltuma alba TaxID=207710 RepID=UPI0010A402EA|nr:L10-interacting MYB domain-containing protein-like [Prosopis alba]
MDNDRGKATLDYYTTKILINVCAEQIVHKERQGTSFTRPGWGKIEKNFQERSGKMYDRRQLKNRFDVLRKDWKLWEKLMSGETGIGYDAATNRPDTEEEEDVYRVELDQQEGSGDSEDENFGMDPTARAGVTDDFAACNINNPASTGPSGSGSYGKRKKGETSDAKKKKKVAASTKISDSLSVIAAAFDKRAAALVEDP